MKTLVTSDAQAIDAIRQAVDSLVPYLSNFVNKFNRIDSIITNTKDLVIAVLDPEAFLKSFIMAKIPDSEFGLPVNKAERLKTLHLPDISEPLRLAEEIRTKVENNSRLSTIADSLNLFDVKDGQVAVNRAAVDAYLDTHRVYIDSKDTARVEFVKLHQAFVKSFFDLKKFSVDTFGENNIAPQFELNMAYGAPFDMHRFIKPHTEEMNPNLMEYFFTNFPVKK